MYVYAYTSLHHNVKVRLNGPIRKLLRVTHRTSTMAQQLNNKRKSSNIKD